ncbi:MAG: aminotransferase class I/II-fold pyridoxal phosphate-dependent enzyme [Nitriliruptoraceae bacterium]
MPTLNPALAAAGPNPLAALREEVAARRAAGADLIDLSIGDPDEPTPEAVRSALRDAVGPVSSYPTARGGDAVRAAIAAFLARRHGVTVDPATQVLPTSGSKEAIFHLPLAFVDPAGPRRGVVFGTPGYPTYARGTRLAGGEPIAVRLREEEGWRLDLAALDADVLARTCVAWINHPHNPTGATVDVAYLRDQLAVARAHDVLLCSDECYQELWSDAPAPSLLEACDGDMTGALAFLSLSKRSGMTGYRSGAIAGDAAPIAVLRRLREDTGTASPEFTQAAAVAAWSDDAHVAERRAAFAAKRAVVLEGLATAGVAWSGSTDGLYVWARVADGDDLALARRLLDAGVVVTPGRAFGAGGEGWVRLALVPDVAGCREAMRRWAAAVPSG